MTYPQRLDALCEQRGWSWRVWDEWRHVTGFERKLYWHGEVTDSDGTLIAETHDYRPDKVWNGHDGAARMLWKALDQAD